MGTINNILPQKIDGETEKIITDKIKNKMFSAAALYISTVRWIEKEYGKEAVEKLRQYQLQRTIKRWEEKRKEFKNNSLEEFCSYMEKSCAGTHEWTKTINKKNRKKYCYTHCIWADIFRELKAGDIGLWICEGDEPAVKAFSQEINFKRTKTLMKGDKCCDHEYFIEKNGE